MINEIIKAKLISLKDDKLLEFEQKLNARDQSLKQLGVRIPLLRNYAKELIRDYDIEFLINNIDEEYYEEVMLKGFVIGHLKDYSVLERYLYDFVPRISDWAVCDTFCASLKLTKKYLKEMYEVIKHYLNSKKEFEVRFALVMLLDYYLIDDYIDEVLMIANNIKSDKYYVKMANAWLLSFALIKYYDRSYHFLKNDCNIDKWTYNKAIQKARESFRLNDVQKEELLKLKV